MGGAWERARREEGSERPCDPWTNRSAADDDDLSLPLKTTRVTRRYI